MVYYLSRIVGGKSKTKKMGEGGGGVSLFSFISWFFLMETVCQRERREKSQTFFFLIVFLTICFFFKQGVFSMAPIPDNSINLWTNEFNLVIN